MTNALPRRTTRTGLQLTELGLGCAQFGNLYREMPDATADEIVDAAWAAGIRMFDTAPHYGLGLSEERLGRALRRYPRDEYVLSTKVGRLLRPNPEGVGLDAEGFVVPNTTRRVRDYSEHGVLTSIEESLERLGLDRIDVVYMHDSDDYWDEAMAGAVPALQRLRSEGVISEFGAGMNQSAMLARFIREGDADIAMVAGRYTLLEQGALADLIPAAGENGASIVIAGVYNSGLLARTRPAADAQYNYADAPAELIARTNAIADVCERHGVTLPEAAVQFPLQQPSVASVVIGASRPAHVPDAVARYTAEIPAALWTDLVAAGLLSEAALPDLS
ncbi:aldo/keto reductase [Leucobacter sp. BZR 635]